MSNQMMYDPQRNRPGGGQRFTGQKQNKMLIKLLAAIGTAVIAVAAVVFILRSEERRKEQLAVQEAVEAVADVYLPNIYADGIPLGGKTAQQGIDEVTANAVARENSWTLKLTYNNQEIITLNYGSLGIRTDINQIYAVLQEAYTIGHVGTMDERKAALDRQQTTRYDVYTTQSEMDDAYLNSILSQMQASFESEPMDAYMVYFYPDLDDPFGIQPERYGTHLNTESLKSEIIRRAQNGEGGTLEITLEKTAPAVTEKDIRSRVTLISEGITPVSTASTTARTDNIRVALSHYNGLVIRPDETISFNTVVGPRTLERGFQYAIEYVEGNEAVNVGGGVCQASTTVYLAALKANLQIVNRTSHSDAVNYTTFGQDATVYYSRDRKIDFSFRNTSGATLYVVARVENVTKSRYQAVVRIYGPSLGEGVKYTLRTETVEEIPAPTTPIYQQDTDHQYVTYKDEEPYLVREARKGYINETYLQRCENGVVVSEWLISRDECKARAAIYYTGTQKRQ